MADSPEAVAQRNREYYETARKVLGRASATITHFRSFSRDGMQFTCARTDLDNPPPEHLDGRELADGAFYAEGWGTKVHSGPVSLPDGSTETIVERYWVRAVYRADGSLEVQSREGDVLVAEAEVGPEASSGRITPVKATVLRGQQGFGKKGFNNAFAVAVGRPVIVREIETTRPSDFELDEPTPYDDRRW